MTFGAKCQRSFLPSRRSGRMEHCWIGWLAVAAGIAHLIRGVGVAHQVFVPSIAALIELALLALWTLVMAVSMWRQSNLRPGPGRHSLLA